MKGLSQGEVRISVDGQVAWEWFGNLLWLVESPRRDRDRYRDQYGIKTLKGTPHLGMEYKVLGEVPRQPGLISEKVFCAVNAQCKIRKLTRSLDVS